MTTAPPALPAPLATRRWEGHAVTVASSLLGETYLRLRSCGQRRRECHALWIARAAPDADPHRIVRLVHSGHTATMVSVELDPTWLNAFFIELATRGECIRAQVHSHPDAAFHSATDDRWPAVRIPGFLSLVIPNFATGASDLARTYLAEQSAGGAWREVSVADRIRVENA